MACLLRRALAVVVRMPRRIYREICTQEQCRVLDHRLPGLVPVAVGLVGGGQEPGQWNDSSVVTVVSCGMTTRIGGRWCGVSRYSPFTTRKHG